MRYIGIITLLVLCLTLLLLIGCEANTLDPVEEPVIEEDIEITVTIYPQQWATGDGTVENPWANDCIQKAYNAVPAGGTIFLKAGYYILSAAVRVIKSVNIIGEGMNKTIIITADAFGFDVTGDHVTLKGFTIDGAAQTDGQQYLSPIVIAHCDYTLLEDIEAKNGGYYGINLYEINHASLQNTYAHNCPIVGIHPGADTAGRNMYNTYQDIYVWDNADRGFYDRGGYADPEVKRGNVYDNIQAWNNETNGISFSYINGGALTNSSAHDNSLSGIYLYKVYNFTIENCLAYSNDESGDEIGVHLLKCDNINLTNVIVKNNNTGINLSDCNNVALASCQSYDDRDTLLQAYGIELAGTNTNISLFNCKLTPNKKGEIYNPAGVVLTVIIWNERKFLLPSF